MTERSRPIVFSRRTFLSALVLAVVGQKDSLRLISNSLDPATIPQPDTKVEEVFETESLVDHVTLSLTNEAFRKRAERRRYESDYDSKIDEELNKNRMNVLLYSYGETHEPPAIEKDIIGSATILSLDLETKKLSAISFTHDIRAPEIERFRNNYPMPIKIYRAFENGGFGLMRQVYENATGLAIDYQVSIDERIFKKLVDEVFGRIDVQVPRDFGVYPIYFDGIKYPGRHFSEGILAMDGLTTLQFIKSVPVADKDKEIEHNARKHLVFRAILGALSQDKFKIAGVLRFVLDKVNREEVVYDSDYINARQILENNKWVILSSLTKIGNFGDVPEDDRTIYVVDSAHGDGGVSWVKSQEHTNPAVRREMENGYYERLRSGGGDPYAFEIPNGGDPYADDLVAGYWQSVRTLVRSRLLGQ